MGTILPKNNNFGNPNRGKEVCRFWNKHQRSPCTLHDQSCKYGRLHKCFTCSKLGCKEIHHGKIPKPTANSCEVRPPQDTHLDPSNQLQVILKPQLSVSSLENQTPTLHQPGPQSIGVLNLLTVYLTLTVASKGFLNKKKK